MKRNPFAGTGKVFGFSIKQICLGKGWLISTILIAALLLGGIPLIFLGITSAVADDDSDTDDARIKTVYVVDETEGEADYSALDETLTYNYCKDMDEAISASQDDETAVILRVTKPEKRYTLTAFLPENTQISRSKAGSFADNAASQFTLILLQKAKMAPEAATLLKMPVMTSTESLAADYDPDAPENDGLKEFLGFLIPFITLMLIYMMVILYGQSMANSVMLEKTSKLMETILTAVQPFPLMLGKLFATAGAAVLQILIWVVCGIAGTVIGAGAAVAMLPDTSEMTPEMAQSAAVTVNNAVDNIKSSEYLVLGALPQVFLIIALGFFLYLSLSAVAGALASKSEDLNKTNVIFVMTLVISMFLCLNMSGEGDGFTMVSSAAWLRFFPFTSILVAPGDLLLGKLSLAAGWGTIGVLVLSVILLTAIAAIIYRMLVLYRGNVPKPKDLLQMFKQSKK